MSGIMIAQASFGASSPWTPLSSGVLLASVFPGLSRSMGLLWQDPTKLIPAVNDGDTVYVATCPFTGIDFVAGSVGQVAKLHSEGGGKWSLALSSSLLTCAALAGVSTQYWAYQVAADGFGTANELSGYDPTGGNKIVGRLYPDINTWYSGDVNDMIGFSVNGNGYVNGMSTTSNSPNATLKTVELIRTTAVTPPTAYYFGWGGALDHWIGRVSGAVICSATPNRALMQAYLAAA
jgi:hypothetical protein